MHEWVDELIRGQWVLDLGGGAGSLQSYEYACSIVSVDSDRDAFAYAYQAASIHFNVVASGDSLPFGPATFDLVLCHHVLEHISNLEGALREISRVLKPEGRLFITVPDGYGLCDGIYRYVFEGGEHVNRFRRKDLTSQVERLAGLRLTGWQKLYSSFAYLARIKGLDAANLPGLPGRLRRLARLPSPLAAALQGFLYVGTRAVDWAARTDFALYGWALYFERTTSSAPNNRPFLNVCLHCGAGIPATGMQRRFGLFYICPVCARRGIYFRPFRDTQ